MKNIKLESVVIVHGKQGSVATIHFSDPAESSYISGPKQTIHMMVSKRISKVLNG